MINKLNKEIIRKQLLIERRRLLPEIIQENSRKIAHSFLKLDIYQQSTNIMLYIATKYEVQTEDIIKSAQKDKKRIFIPLIIQKENKLLPSLVCDFGQELTIGALGIMQPKREFYRIYPPSVLDLVVVPGVAFTIQGYRLGRGGGYYDQFLTQLDTSSLSVALAFEMQILEKIPCTEKDIPVDYIITEKRVIKIKK